MAASKHKGETRYSVVFASRDASGKTAGANKKGGTASLLIQLFPSTLALLGGIEIASDEQKQVKASGTAKGKAAKTGQVTLKRGSKGAGSMKLDAGVVSGKRKYISIPVPSGATLMDMIAFASKCSKLKPTFLVSPEGRKHDVSVYAKAAGKAKPTP